MLLQNISPSSAEYLVSMTFSFLIELMAQDYGKFRDFSKWVITVLRQATKHKLKTSYVYT